MDRYDVIEALDYISKFGDEHCTLKICLSVENEVVTVTDLTTISARVGYLLITAPGQRLFFVPYNAITALLYT